eukprot:TRINITY_DN11582_c0_g2_i1.p1 TRINITY_DN11582_c0_g2~~TRINITY_DN11582_c0_g2_i1.p1  ORF type:complete len:591 (+),score=111.43 TRINITY_DN11582_c0_g2_i1:68-1840(+)
MHPAELPCPAACLVALFLCVWSTRRHLSNPRSFLRPLLEHTSNWRKSWRSPRILDEQQRLNEERIERRLMQYRVAYAGFLCLVMAWFCAVLLLLAGGRVATMSGEDEQYLLRESSKGVVFLIFWIGSFIDLQKWHLDVLFSVNCLVMALWQLKPEDAISYYRAPVALVMTLLSCLVRDQAVSVAGIVVVYACRCYAEHKVFDDVVEISTEQNFASFMVRGTGFELMWMTIVIVGRLSIDETAKYIFRAKLTETSAEVESESLNKMVAGLSDCLIRLDHRLHLSGDPQKLPQLLRSISSTSFHWANIDFMKYVTDEDQDRFRELVSESDDSTKSSSMAEAMHLTLVNGSGVRVLVQLFHARILGSLKDEAHLLAIKDLSQEQETAAAADDTVFDLVPRSSIGSVKSVSKDSRSSGSRSSGGSSERKRSEKAHRKTHASDDKVEVNMQMHVEADPEGVNLVNYEVKLQGKRAKRMSTYLERFVKPSDWLNLKMALESKLDPSAPCVGLSTYAHPISFNLPPLGMVSPSKLQMFIPHFPEEGRPTKVVLIPHVNDSKEQQQEDKRRRLDLQNRADDALADPVCTEVAACKFAL